MLAMQIGKRIDCVSRSEIPLSTTGSWEESLKFYENLCMSYNLNTKEWKNIMRWKEKLFSSDWKMNVKNSRHAESKDILFVEFGCIFKNKGKDFDAEERSHASI